MFTGFIVIAMLLTLFYLVYKRKNRFSKMENELLRKKTTMHESGNLSNSD